MSNILLIFRHIFTPDRTGSNSQLLSIATWTGDEFIDESVPDVFQQSLTDFKVSLREKVKLYFLRWGLHDFHCFWQRTCYTKGENQTLKDILIDSWAYTEHLNSKNSYTAIQGSTICTTNYDFSILPLLFCNSHFYLIETKYENSKKLHALGSVPSNYHL